MDILEFNDPKLYFDEPLPAGVDRLLDQAARDYEHQNAWAALNQARRIAPSHPTVLIAVFRYHYYQHNLFQARTVAEQALEEFRRRLRLPKEHGDVGLEAFSRAFADDPAGARFYLNALKSIGYLSLRLQEHERAIETLSTIVRLDTRDRLNCSALLRLATDSRPATPFIRTYKEPSHDQL